MKDNEVHSAVLHFGITPLGDAHRRHAVRKVDDFAYFVQILRRAPEHNNQTQDSQPKRTTRNGALRRVGSIHARLAGRSPLQNVPRGA